MYYHGCIILDTRTRLNTYRRKTEGHTNNCKIKCGNIEQIAYSSTVVNNRVSWYP